jgi:hypothetical protein
MEFPVLGFVVRHSWLLDVGSKSAGACIPAVVLPGLLSVAGWQRQQGMAASKLQRECCPAVIKPSWSRLKLQD